MAETDYGNPHKYVLRGLVHHSIHQHNIIPVILVEMLLCSVAMVNIPVHYEYTRSEDIRTHT